MAITFSISPVQSEYIEGDVVTFSVKMDSVTSGRFAFRLGYVLDNADPNSAAVVTNTDNVDVTDGYNATQTYKMIIPAKAGHTITFIKDNSWGKSGAAVDLGTWDTLANCTVGSGTIKSANTAPSISGNDNNLGDKYETFNTSFVVSDAQDTGDLQLTVKLDNVQLTTYPVAQNSTNNYYIPSSKFSSLSLGTHTLQLIVADSGGLTTTRTYTFTKINPPNVAPTISGYDENLGQQYKSFTQNFSVNDANPNDIITAIIKVDNEQINSFIAQRNINYVVDLAGIFRGLALGQHIITITASDNNGSSTTRTYTFEKINSPYNSIDFIKTVPTRKLVSEIAYICEEFINAQVGIDTVYILASNNPFDDEPIWEEVAAAPYEFKNKISVEYGVGIRVIIERNSNVSGTVLATNLDEIVTTNRNEALEVE